jgi:RNA polymerase sigma-70 factor (ECF subfamily)
MTPIPPDLIPLLTRLRAGDPAALADLFNHHRPQLRRMVELRLSPALAGRVNASDVLQEAYIDAQQRYPHFFDKPDHSFYVWLRLVVNQSLVAVHRRHLGAKMRAAHAEISIDRQPLSGAMSVSLARELIAQIQSPSQVARHAEVLAQVEQAIESLDPIDREILTLRHFEELTNDEVAELLSLSKAAASNRYVRALGRLRDVLAKLPGFFDE